MRVTNDINYDEDFRPIFEEFTEEVELRNVETVQAGMMTELRYGIRLKKGKALSEFIEKLQLANGNNRILVTSKQGNLYT